MYIAPHVRAQSKSVYLIATDPLDCIKIGVSIDPPTRLRDIQRWSPYPVTLYRAYPQIDALKAERALHQMLALYWLHGEWFRFPQPDTFVREVIDPLFVQGEVVDQIPDYRRGPTETHYQSLHRLRAAEAVARGVLS